MSHLSLSLVCIVRASSFSEFMRHETGSSLLFNYRLEKENTRCYDCHCRCNCGFVIISGYKKRRDCGSLLALLWQTSELLQGVYVNLCTVESPRMRSEPQSKGRPGGPQHHFWPSSPPLWQKAQKYLLLWLWCWSRQAVEVEWIQSTPVKDDVKLLPNRLETMKGNQGSWHASLLEKTSGHRLWLPALVFLIGKECDERAAH